MKNKKIWSKAIDIGWSLVLLMPLLGVLLALFRNGYDLIEYNTINWAVVFQGYTWVSSLPSFNTVLNLFKNAGLVSSGNISYVFFCFGFNVLFMTAIRFVFRVMLSLFFFMDRLTSKMMSGGVE